MMEGDFYPLRYYDNNGKVRNRIDVNHNNDSKWECFHNLSDHIEQLIRYDYDIINNETSMVELIVHSDNTNDKIMNCKFRERVNGKLKDVPPQNVEYQPFEGS